MLEYFIFLNKSPVKFYITAQLISIDNLIYLKTILHSIYPKNIEEDKIFTLPEHGTLKLNPEEKFAGIKLIAPDKHKMHYTAGEAGDTAILIIEEAILEISNLN